MRIQKAVIHNGLVLRRAAAVSAILFFHTIAPPAYSAVLSIEKDAGQVRVSWGGEFGLVQPQRTGDLGGGVWDDFGGPTSDANVTDSVGAAPFFYRLRFLSPRILSQPAGIRAVPGSAATLSVNAAGSSELIFQWRKDGVSLEGATGATLTLDNVDAAAAGGYDVVISNSIGSVTSDTAQVSISEPQGPPRGIFMGRFAGQEESGGFALMVNSEGKAVALGYSPAQGQGIVATNFVVAVDNSFEVSSARGGTLKGVFTEGMVSGSFTSTNATTEAFTGVLKEPTGIHESDAGYYEGVFGGLLSGDASLLLAADGTVFVYTFSPVVGGGGTFAIIDASNKVSATTEFTLPGTTMPGVLAIDGGLDPSTHRFSGSYSFGGIQLGTISIARVSVP